jgi:hypothetical protein
MKDSLAVHRDYINLASSTPSKATTSERAGRSRGEAPEAPCARAPCTRPRARERKESTWKATDGGVNMGDSCTCVCV